MDFIAIKVAVTISLVYYLFITYWKTLVSVAWQSWGSFVLPNSIVKKLPSSGLWAIPKNGEPLRFHWFPFITQAKLRFFVVLTTVMYVLVSEYGLGISDTLIFIIRLGLFSYMFFYCPIVIFLRRKLDVTNLVERGLSSVVLALIITLAMKY